MNTKVKDELGNKTELDLSKHAWIPNYFFEDIFSLLADDESERTKVIFSSSIYDTRKKHISKEKTSKNHLPIVHTMTLKGHSCVYSSEDKGHFGIPKVILSFNEIQRCPINDWKGEYGMSQIAFAIPVDSEEDGERLVDFMMSEQGKQIVAATKWSTFQTDWRLFTYFKEGFWR